MSTRKPYPSDVSDEEWAFVAPYLSLLPPDAGQREHSLREVFNGIRRFDDIRSHSGVPRQVLTNRLNLLVEHDVLRRGVLRGRRSL